MSRRTWVLFCAALCLVAIFTTGCGSSSSSSGGTKLRLVNGTPDEAGLDLLVDTKSVATNVGYGAASAYVSVQPGSRELQVEPSGNPTILFTTTVNPSAGSNLTLVTLNFSFNISNVVLVDDNSAPTSGNFKLRIFNASPGMGPQDVYIVTAGTDITTVEPTFTSLGFGSDSVYSSLTAGDYQVVFTSPGSKFINLDSGTLTFTAGQVRTVLGLNNPAGGFLSTVLADVN
jgi:hypothetical protein